MLQKTVLQKNALQRIVSIAAAAIALAACAGSPGDDLPPFGETVMAVKEAQTWNEGDNVPTLSGDRGSRSMEAYRKRGSESGKQASSPTMDVVAK